ncbi:MAG: class I SAM-dependent methyltransferase [Candidatus Binatia bacterium]
MIAITEKLARGALDELNFHFAPQIVLFTAIKLGIFPVIEKGAKGVESIASATGCSTRGVRMVLNCLTAMGLLDKEKEIYDLNHLSQKFLLPYSEEYIGHLFMHGDKLLKLWLTLPEAVRTGRPPLSLFTKEEREGLNVAIADALFQVHRVYAWRLVDVLADHSSTLAECNPICKILDVAAGSAVWSLPFALKYKDVKVTATDFVPVLEVTRRYARQFGVENRYRFIGADIRETEFGSDEYDLVFLGHICHSEGAQWSQRLIGNCFRALRKNGKLLIMDYIPDEERKSHMLPLLLAVNALLGTEEGDTFTFSEYKHWLLNAGFKDAQTIPINDRSPIIVGIKG